MAELELGVGQQDPALGGDRTGSLVDSQREVLECVDQCVTEPLPGLGHRDVFVVVPLLGLGGGGEDRRIQAGGLGEAGRQVVAAHGAAGAVVGQARAGEVAAGHALQRHHVQAAAAQSPAGHLGGDVLGRQHVVGHQISQLLEPEQADRGEDPALVRDPRLQGMVVRADPVGGDHQHLCRLRGVRPGGHVQLPHLAADGMVPAGQHRRGQQGLRAPVPFSAHRSARLRRPRCAPRPGRCRCGAGSPAARSAPPRPSRPRGQPAGPHRCRPPPARDRRN